MIINSLGYNGIRTVCYKKGTLRELSRALGNKKTE
jgi:hypothetical protein